VQERTQAQATGAAVSDLESVARATRTITRDRLKEMLWPTDTFVDFDPSLNAAIAKLRQALGDSAENPRFIETLARRGYRFIAPVEITRNGGGNVVPVSAPASAGAASPVQEISLLRHLQQSNQKPGLLP
jgi:DNA-binding winged helix-turn-helix (wHTH) protein